MVETLSEKQPLPWWRRILLGFVLIAMALVAVLILIGYLAERQLGEEIVKISQTGEPVTFSDLEADLDQSGTHEDAARYYAEALDGISQESLEVLRRFNTFYLKNMGFLPVSQFPSVVREKVAQHLSNLRPVLERFDKGAALPLSRFEIGIDQGIQVCKARLDCAQTAIILLSLRTLDMKLCAEDDAAVNSAISMLKMVRIFDTHPVMVLHGAKLAFVGLACNDIVLLLGYGRHSEKSLAELQQVLSETIASNALERMFFAERVYQTEIGRNLIPEHIASRFLQDKVPDLPERLSLPASRWTRLRQRQASVRYFHDMAQSITASRRPWPEPLDAMVYDVPASKEKPSNVLSSSTAFIRLTGKILALVRCTILAVAIERYRLSRGELPGSLNDLSPPYIDSIPLDPFTGKKLLYKRVGETYLVYSVGINRRDDDGSIMPSADGEGAQDLGFRIRFRELE
jgi:hypothetical protein